MDWRTSQIDMPSTRKGWQCRRNKRRIISGQEAIAAEVARWHALDPLVISEPGSNRFVPVLDLNQYQRVAHMSAVRRQLLSMLIALIVALVFAGIWFVEHRDEAITFVQVFLALGLFLTLDYWLVIRRLAALKERASFVVWIYQHGRMEVLFCTGLMALTGILQLILQYQFGGFEPMMRHYGVVFENVENGEWWRFLVGPYFHASVAHWIANAAILIFIGPIIGALSRYHGLLTFVLGSTLGAIASFASAEFTNYDSYVGVSGGIFAMMGWCAGFGMSNPKRLPAKFAFTIATFAIVNGILSALMIPDSSTSAHVVTLITGFLLGMTVCRGNDDASFEQQRPVS